MAKSCPECSESMKAESFNEGTHYVCSCGRNEFWHVGGSESDPQVWRTAATRSAEKPHED